MTIAPQMNRKHVVAALEINWKSAVFGTTKFAKTAIAITKVENLIAFAGTCLLERVLIFFSNLELPLYVNENIIRPVLKIELLHADAAAVKTTKLIMPAAAAIPTFSNTCTNGLWEIVIDFHG